MKLEKIEVSGLIVLFVGVILLAATFYSAFVFLIAKVTIGQSIDLAELFGSALAPLIEAIIHILYLGVMGWIGSILTIRGVQLLKKEKEAAATQPQARTETKQNVASSTPQNQPKPELPKEVKEPKKAETPEQAAAPKQPAEPPREATIDKSAQKPVESATP